MYFYVFIGLLCIYCILVYLYLLFSSLLFVIISVISIHDIDIRTCTWFSFGKIEHLCNTSHPSQLHINAVWKASFAIRVNLCYRKTKFGIGTSNLLHLIEVWHKRQFYIEICTVYKISGPIDVLRDNDNLTYWNSK